MKRFIAFIFCIFPLLLLAQEVQKVAILETVDREGNISYAHKLMLRSNLAKAITNAPGYEAYDRTDMDAILGEQNFQRTGMVSNEQIKRLGEMTGAAFILVAEAVKVDEQNMFITAKILNVETAKTEATENILVAFTSSEIQYGCECLANKLLGLAPPTIQPSSQNTTQAYTQTYNPSQPGQFTQEGLEETMLINGLDANTTIQFNNVSTLQLLWMDKSYSSACRRAGKKVYYQIFNEYYTPAFKRAKQSGLNQMKAIEQAIQEVFPKAVEASNNTVLECSGTLYQ